MSQNNPELSDCNSLISGQRERALRPSLRPAGAVAAARGGADWGAGTIKVDRRLSGGWGEMAAWEPNPYQVDRNDSTGVV